MSQAFVKEGDASDDLPERPVSDRPNYVTPAGLADLRRRHDGLLERRAALVSPRRPDTEAELKLVERDLRYLEGRLKSAIPVDRKGEASERVLFGSTVEVSDAEGRRRYAIVGEDEADPADGKLAWSSPLALALMGARKGDEVAWSGPDGERRLSVLSVA